MTHAVWPRILALIAALAATATAGRADFLKRDDVVALVGGEEMVALSESGELELLLTRAFPAHRIRFRDLAWEGDTVFEQHRDLNYPTLPEQLDRVGATVVIAQFGQMESLAGPARLAEFVAAYEKLADQLTAKGKRRLVFVEPSGFEHSGIAPAHLRERHVATYREAIAQLAKRRNSLYAESLRLRELFDEAPRRPSVSLLIASPRLTRDGVHLRPNLLTLRAQAIAAVFSAAKDDPALASKGAEDRLREAIAVKNRLWFHYHRPQNWAFLAGDRVSQPSSRDHRDLNKRWFPEEMEKFLPLITAKEAEIWELASALHR